MELQMPVMDGCTAMRQIRKWELENSRPRTPIIVLTASVLKEDALRSFAAGAGHHAIKPIKIVILLDTIRKTLEKIERELAAL